jgi:hypothetical protein
MATLSSSTSLDALIVNNETTDGGTEGNTSNLKDSLGLSISPYGIMYLGAGKLNFSLNIDAFNIKDWDSFLKNISVIAGYKVAL